MTSLVVTVYILVFLPFSLEFAIHGNCEVRVQTDAGWVCGVYRHAGEYTYARFLNVPYAKQPLRELRFKELQPPEPWSYLYDATKAGPICPQFEVYYGKLMTNLRMSEACIHANVYVPANALPGNSTCKYGAGLPVLVFIHGGGFLMGSGDPDLYGPELLIQKNIIIITFNERSNVFGYLSLNSTSIPGNNGLRDAVSLLRWVQRNARFFGGNRNDVTLGGQSAGSLNAHLLTLSKAANNLFKRTILMSGVGVRSFFTGNPEQAKKIADLFLQNLGITEKDPEKVHQQLIQLPLETIMNASVQVEFTNLISWAPVIETAGSTGTVVIDKDPEELLKEGQGKNIPLLIGFTNMEGQFFLNFFRKYKILEKFKENPFAFISPDLASKLPRERAFRIAKQTEERYFKGNGTYKKLLKAFSDVAFVYPALKLAQMRASHDSAPVYLYHFAYKPDFSAIEVANGIKYDGAAHAEDLTFIFQTNSLKKYKGYSHSSRNDYFIRQLMTMYVKNFMTCSAPICEPSTNFAWPKENPGYSVKYKYILKPSKIIYTDITADQKNVVQYFDKFYEEAIAFSRNVSTV